MRFKNVILAGGILGVLAACTDNPNETKLQYFPDMADSPGIKTQGNYIDPPEGSIARSAILYPDSPEEAEKVLFNPFTDKPNEDKHIENGKHLFQTFCAVCHGDSAKGDGRITDKFPRPPDLTLDLYKKRLDGFYFYRITYGSALMPSYGHATTALERWEITSYLRTLQNAPPLPPPAPTPPPAPASDAEKEGAKKADAVPASPNSTTTPSKKANASQPAQPSKDGAKQ